MDLVVILLVFVITLAILKTFYFNPERLYNLPAGPRGLPLVGNLPQIIINPHIKLSEWVSQYGPLFTLNFGTRKALTVSNVKLIREIFSLPASAGKYKTDKFLLTTRGPYGVLITDGEEWSEQRPFLMRSLVKHGFGNKSKIEPFIISEVQGAVEWIKKEMAENGAVSLLEIFRIATNNTLLTMVTGDRVALENTRVSKLLEILLMRSGLNFLPVMKYIAPSISGYSDLDKASQDVDDFISGYIDEHKRTFVPGVERDVIDCYLEQMRTVEDPKSSFYGVKGDRNSRSTISEIFIAGGETTPIALTWLVLYLCHHQDVQKKLHSEIDNVIGKDREPCITDKPKMPYTEAVISETLRKASLVPLGLIHELLEDIEFQEYRLPKGMLLLANLYHAHHDKEVWSDPEAFRPERFLEMNESGTLTVVKKENVEAFQAGKRTCIGEPLARDVLFIFVSKLFQAFQVAPDPANPKPNWEPNVGICLVPKPYKVVMKPRT